MLSDRIQCNTFYEKSQYIIKKIITDCSGDLLPFRRLKFMPRYNMPNAAPHQPHIIQQKGARHCLLGQCQALFLLRRAPAQRTLKRSLLFSFAAIMVSSYFQFTNAQVQRE